MNLNTTGTRRMIVTSWAALTAWYCHCQDISRSIQVLIVVMMACKFCVFKSTTVLLVLRNAEFIGGCDIASTLTELEQHHRSSHQATPLWLVQFLDEMLWSCDGNAIITGGFHHSSPTPKKMKAITTLFWISFFQWQHRFFPAWNHPLFLRWCRCTRMVS